MNGENTSIMEQPRNTGFNEAIEGVESAAIRIQSAICQLESFNQRIVGVFPTEVAGSSAAKSPNEPQGLLPRLTNEIKKLHDLMDIAERKINDLEHNLD